MTWRHLKKPTLKIWLFYSILTLVVMLPLLRRGYILTMDMVFTPHIAQPHIVNNNYIFFWVLHVLNVVIPSMVIQKLLLLGIMFWSGLGMHRLAEFIAGTPTKLPKAKKPKFEVVRAPVKQKAYLPPVVGQSAGNYFAGILYVVNPYTYERWLAGHYLLLAGYALLPWLLRALFGYFNRPKAHLGAKLALYFAFMGLLSIHMLAISIVVAVSALVVYLVYAPVKWVYLKKLIGTGVLAAAIFAAAAMYWLYGVLRGDSPLQQAVATFNQGHLEAFTTAAQPHAGLLFNVLGMYGFWAERYHRFVLPNTNLFVIIPFLAVLAVLVVAGIPKQLKKDRPQAIVLLVLALVGFMVASGIHAPIWGGVNDWVLLHVPLMRGFREPQKFSVLLVVAYCLFASASVRHFASRAQQNQSGSWYSYVPTALLVLPLALTPLMPFGFAGQLKPVQYPPSWYAFNTQIEQESGDFKVLFLPWHEYTSFDFNGRIIANPAPTFFSKTVLSGDSAELGSVGREKPNGTSDFIEQEILTKPEDPGMGPKLTAIGVKYIVLANAPDADKYGFLTDQPALQQVSKSHSLIVYLNTDYK